jgi:hypothetical protein
LHGLKSQEKLIKNQDALLNSYEELRGKRAEISAFGRLHRRYSFEQAELSGYAFSHDAIQPQHANAIVASGHAGLDEGAVENSHDAS